jgi:hypothetical protein
MAYHTGNAKESQPVAGKESGIKAPENCLCTKEFLKMQKSF